MTVCSVLGPLIDRREVDGSKVLCESDCKRGDLCESLSIRCELQAESSEPLDRSNSIDGLTRSFRAVQVTSPVEPLPFSFRKTPTNSNSPTIRNNPLCLITRALSSFSFTSLSVAFDEPGLRPCRRRAENGGVKRTGNR